MESQARTLSENRASRENASLCYKPLKVERLHAKIGQVIVERDFVRPAATFVQRSQVISILLERDFDLLDCLAVSADYDFRILLADPARRHSGMTFDRIFLYSHIKCAASSTHPIRQRCQATNFDGFILKPIAG